MFKDIIKPTNPQDVSYENFLHRRWKIVGDDGKVREFTAEETHFIDSAITQLANDIDSNKSQHYNPRVKEQVVTKIASTGVIC